MYPNTPFSFIKIDKDEVKYGWVPRVIEYVRFLREGWFEGKIILEWISESQYIHTIRQGLDEAGFINNIYIQWFGVAQAKLLK